MSEKDTATERLEELSPIVKEILEVLNKDENLDYKIVDLIEALSLVSGIMVTTSIDEESVMLAEQEGEQIFNYLMRGLRTYTEKENVLHGSLLLGLIKTLGFLSGFIAKNEKEQAVTPVQEVKPQRKKPSKPKQQKL